MNTPRSQKPYAPLKGLDNLFGAPDNVAQSGTPTEVALNRIKTSFTFTPNKKPLRHFYDRDAIKQWVQADLRVNGIHSPLLLRPHPLEPGLYELVDGMTRYIAADEFLAYETVQAVIRDLDDAQAYRAATASNTNRKKFTALEYLDHAISLLADALGLTPKGTVSLLYKFNNESKKKGDENHSAMVADPQFQTVVGVFDFLGQTTWKSFVANYLPLLNLPESITYAIKTGKIEYSKGLDISRVKDEDARETLLADAIAQDLSQSEIQTRIRALQGSKSVVELSPVRQRFTQAIKQLNKSQIWDDPEKATELAQLTQRLEQLLGT